VDARERAEELSAFSPVWSLAGATHRLTLPTWLFLVAPSVRVNGQNQVHPGGRALTRGFPQLSDFLNADATQTVDVLLPGVFGF